MNQKNHSDSLHVIPWNGLRIQTNAGEKTSGLLFKIINEHIPTVEQKVKENPSK